MRSAMPFVVAAPSDHWLLTEALNTSLVNNHILSRQDQAVAGEDISQPGLIDNSCQPATIVADFTAAPALGSNVDAA
jgi:hypothetical protein